ncbi:transketolase family protein [Candidatus Saccharibacteria bacterium]|nr:transketolase family protein [Candidatus Saccharibacteria bacterium]
MSNSERKKADYAEHLSGDLFSDTIEQAPIRKGFGQGLVEAGTADPNVVALCADLTESTQIEPFAKAFPERFIEVGVAEQNLVTVASGLAAGGKIPFCSSYAAFSPGRNWEQIRTTVCLNEQPVKIVGSHAGLSVGPDGATHQMLEDIALMRVLPHMTVVVPCDSEEARKATIALAKTNAPAYLRLAREKSPLITTKDSPFRIGKADIWRNGADATVIVAGPLAYEAIKAVEALAKKGVDIELINCHTIKPLDIETIVKSAAKTRAVVTVEEGQIYGGLGSVIAETLAQHQPTAMEMVGVADVFGQSGTVTELWEHYGLSASHIVGAIGRVLERKGK